MSTRVLDALIAAVLIAFVVLLAALAIECKTAHADDRRPVPEHEWREARLALAHAIQIEGGSDADAAAILHVLAYRWRVQRRGWSFVESVRRYIRPMFLGPQTPRQRRILWGQKAWADVPGRVRDLLERWATGRAPSPCRNAVHWGGRELWSPLPRVECSQRTYNVFYAAARR